MTTRFPRISTFKNAVDFRCHVRRLGVEIDCDDDILAGPESPLGQAARVGEFLVGNRFAVQPMEGWDGTRAGGPTDLTRRRWRNFGASGAKLIWGGEACAVVPEGRANPNQLMVCEATRGGLAELRQLLIHAHRESCGDDGDLLLGLQLTHSGRFCRPDRNDQMVPAILFRHPILDSKFGLDGSEAILSDDDVQRLVEAFVKGAVIAADVGFHFVDIKHCHGYLGHEFLSAHTRPGNYGGSFENRTRFCREVVAGIRSKVPQLGIGVRLSAFDLVPFHPDSERAVGGKLGPGIPESYDNCLPYVYSFGTRTDDPLCWDLTETFAFIEMLAEIDIDLINLSCGSPYYNPHIQRPALFPPSDGYQPPEDPLVGVARQLQMVALVKERFPSSRIVGSGYSYLQEYLPHVAQHYVRTKLVDFVGLGRMALSYPHLPLDVLQRGRLDRRLLCRTFSDCTTAPRHGMISGCFPLDSFYRARPEAEKLKKIKGATS